MNEAPPDNQNESREGRGVLVRTAIWGAIAIALIVGIVLFFRFGRDMSSLL